jgi:hypothetical protein
MPLNHLLLLEESFRHKPEKISLVALGSPPGVVSAGVGSPYLEGGRLLALVISGPLLASASPRNSFFQHFLAEIDESLLAHALRGSRGGRISLYGGGSRCSTTDL